MTASAPVYKAQGCAKLKNSTSEATYESAGQGVVTVASYNITGQNAGKGRSWLNRRQGVASFILACMPDVVGLQEASAAWLKQSDGKTVINKSQYEDLVSLLNARLRDKGYSDRYAVTNVERSHCNKDPLNTGCTNPSGSGVSSGDTRVIYDKAKIDLLKQGYKRLPSLDDPRKARFVSWAWFRDKATGKPFFLADTHLEYNASNAFRRSEMKVLLAEVREENTNNYPVVIVGDLNSTRYHMKANAVDLARADGIGEILGQDRTVYGSHRGSCRVKRSAYTVPFTASARKFAYYDTSNKLSTSHCVSPAKNVKKANWWKYNGIAIDYILASRDSVRPRAWETKANINGRGGYSGAKPSDHNMIMATLVLL